MPEMYTPYAPAEEIRDYIDPIFKLQMRDLFESYHGEYDVLIELIQNSVDALEAYYNSLVEGERESVQLRLNVEIDQRSNTVRIYDNGIGMNENIAKKALAPNFSYKHMLFSGERTRYRGHKGVGLTYVAYLSSSLKFATKKDGNLFTGELNDAVKWVLDDEGEVDKPLVHSTSYDPHFLEGSTHGTCMEVTLDSKYFPTKNLTWNGWEQVLRTQTAIGYCDLESMSHFQNNVRIKLKLVDKEGIEIEPPEGSPEIPFKFLFPHETSLTSPSARLSELRRRYPARVELPESERGKYGFIYEIWDNELANDLISTESATERATFQEFLQKHKVKIYGAFAYSQDIWKIMDNGYSGDKRLRFWYPGTRIVTEHMSVGTQLDVSLDYGAGNQNRIAVVVEGENIKPDYGRKSFPKNVVEFAQEVAKNAIKKFVENRALLVPSPHVHGPTRSEQELSLEELKRRAADLDALGLRGFSFIKVPQSEQDVVALFHEMLGRGAINGFKVLSVYQGQALYDSVILYSLKREEGAIYSSENMLGVPERVFPAAGEIKTYEKILEFKYLLTNLIQDCESGEKSFSDITFAVVWDIGDTDAFESGYDLIDLTEEGGYSKRRYYATTHQLVYAQGADPIHVICLKRIVDLLQE